MGKHEWLDADYVNFTGLLSLGAPYNFLTTPRRRGKTWGIFTRAYKHYKRAHRGTILVRRTEDATRYTKHGAYTRKYCRKMGIDPDSIRINGDYAELHEGDKWTPFLQFVTLSACSEQRSNDDDFYDLMILDEGIVSARKRAAYHGDEVMDLMDLYDSKRREGRMQLLIIGNRESVGSPYLQFFGILPPPVDFNGVMRYMGGSVAVAQSTRECREVDDFDRKVKRAIEGTRYGQAAYHGIPKDVDLHHLKPKPKGARLWCCFDFGVPLTCWTSGGVYYFTRGVDKTRTIVVPRMGTAYPSVMVYTIRDRVNFEPLRKAKRDNAVYSSDAAVSEAVHELFEALHI